MAKEAVCHFTVDLSGAEFTAAVEHTHRKCSYVYYTYLYNTTTGLLSCSSGNTLAVVNSLPPPCKYLAIPDHTLTTVIILCTIYKTRLGALTDRHDVHGHTDITSGMRRGAARVTPLGMMVGGGTPLQQRKQTYIIIIRPFGLCGSRYYIIFHYYNT